MLSAFIYERVFDLLVVLSFVVIAAANFEVFPIVLVFVLLVLAGVFLLDMCPGRLQLAANHLESRHMRRLARFAEVFAYGFAHTRFWLKPLDLCVSFGTGLLAWGLTAYAFVLLLDQLGLGVPTWQAFSLYPVAMLAGAASMLPGGIGSTEAVLIVLLSGLGVNMAMSTVAAIGIRIATLWFSPRCLGCYRCFYLSFYSGPMSGAPLTHVNPRKRGSTRMEKPRCPSSLSECAVQRRCFPAGVNPARPLSLRPEATGAVMEVTKWLKPLVKKVLKGTWRPCRP